jgi:hypothetical protein
MQLLDYRKRALKTNIMEKVAKLGSWAEERLRYF